MNQDEKREQALDKEQESLSEEERLRIEELQEEREIMDLGFNLKEKIIRSKGKFSETIPLTGDGEIEMETPEGILLSFFVMKATVDQGVERRGEESLFQLAQRVNDRFPELQFGFEQDPERSWIKYTVTEGLFNK